MKNFNLTTLKKSCEVCRLNLTFEDENTGITYQRELNFDGNSSPYAAYVVIDALNSMTTNIPLIQTFEQEIVSRSSEINEDNDQDLASLTYGWALGKGLSPKEAGDFSRYVRIPLERNYNVSE